MSSRWPTDLEPDGTAPVSIMLMGSDDAHLTRQAMYQVVAGARLKDTGFQIAAFQVPLVGRMARITIPISATTPAGQKAAIYTQSEEWTPERLTDLRTWIGDLREASDADVIVASRVPPPEPGAVPEVARWLHVPFDEMKSAPPPAALAREPVMPSLKERQWVGRDKTACRVLWEKQASAYMPWIGLGYDRPHTFAFINLEDVAAMNTTELALEAEAIANLRARPAEWIRADIDVQGQKLPLLTCSGDYFSAEHILDVPFMLRGQQMLKAPGLLVGVPRRSVMLATRPGLDARVSTAFAALVADAFRRQETAPISPAVFAVKDGEIVGIVEEVADAVLSAKADEAPAADDPDAPYVTGLVVKNDRGTEDVLLMAGGQDGKRLAKAIEDGFMGLMQKHGTRQDFSGHLQVVVLKMTPPSARELIPKTIEHIRGIAADLSKPGGRLYRVSVVYQQDESPAPPPVVAPPVAKAPITRPPAAKAPARPAVRPPVPAPEPPAAGRITWLPRVMLIAAVLAAIALWYFATGRVGGSSPRFPGSIAFDAGTLDRAVPAWTRRGTSGIVYTPQGEQNLATASPQVGVIVSTDYSSDGKLLAWIREQSQLANHIRSYDSGKNGGSETCVAAAGDVAGGKRTYMTLQVCRTGTGRAACVESDELLDLDLYKQCRVTDGCFEEECDRRWTLRRGDLERLATLAAGPGIR